MGEDASSRTRGIAIALAGVVSVSPDAMLLRWMRSLGASSPDVAVAKYIGIIACMLIIGHRRGLSAARQSVLHFLASAFTQLLYQLTFTFCLLLTDAAKALLLISLAPLWAALLGMVALGETLPRRTLIAMGACMCGVGLVFMPRLLSVEGRDSGDSGDGGDGAAAAAANSAQTPVVYDSLLGDLLAIATGMAQGLSLTVSRHAALHSPGADLTLATALSSLVAAVVAVELPCYDVSESERASVETTFWACTPPVWRTPGFLGLALCDALAVAAFYTSMLIAPRYITGGEVALVMLLEVVLGPLWVHVRFGDVPSSWTVAGGVVLLTSLAVHESVGHGKIGQRAAASLSTGELSPTARGMVDTTGPASTQEDKEGREGMMKVGVDVGERPYHRFEKN